MDKKQTLVVVGIVAAVIVIILGVVFGLKSCKKEEDLVPVESTTTSAGVSDGSSVVSDVTDPSSPVTEFGEQIIGPDGEIVIIPTGSDATTAGGSGSGNSGSGQTPDPTNDTLIQPTLPTSEDDGVIELPFVPADQL
ncbi:MAG: hypothetical protein J6Z43_04110 [Clostridiales bacterium]|nr:hypothetical protein [Clostridiales bacterium]